MNPALTANTFQENLMDVRSRVAAACRATGRALDSVDILAVSKTHPAETVRLAFDEGLTHFGENRVQEALPKIAACDAAIRWELVGHLQSNKARAAIAAFHRIQTVDSLKLIQLLARLVEEGGAPSPYPILLQVNAGNDPAKYGCSLDQTEHLLQVALETGRLRVDGLMTIAPLDENPATARRCFARLRILRDQLQTSTGQPLSTLSMGMTSDLEEAIAEGSTLIRIGSALFGTRP